MELFSFQYNYDDVYTPTHNRISSYLIGFIAGYILLEYPKGSNCIPKACLCLSLIQSFRTINTRLYFLPNLQKLNVFAWTCSLIAMPAVVIGNFKYYQETTNSSALEFGLFDSLARVAWSISLSYIIFACIHDSGGPINRFLSLSIYQPLSKLSFTIYLIHCLVLGATTLTFQTSPSFSEMAAYQSAISVFVISAFISIPLVLAFELPVDAIYKLTMSTKNKKSPSIPAPSKPIEQPC